VVDEAGHVSDETLAKLLTLYVDALARWLARVGPGQH
jgi:hypothetical protein